MKFNASYIAPRVDIAADIEGKGLKILDIGCSNGANGKYLKEAGIASWVTGVEYDHDMAKAALDILDEVHHGSIESTELIDRLPDDFFDYVLFGDVLEHLDNPWEVLSRLRMKLNRSGKVIISIPNSGHIDVAIHLLFKKSWPLNERGIFDRTHRRFFAYNDIESLVGRGGFQTLSIKRKFRYRDQLGSKFPFYGRFLKKLLPDWYTFQFVIVAGQK
ncbi:class I SAM-dependent methyltransferase [Flavihumibacter solisilvae]|uniref:class I SAM-dependent methyltransferase n=1 Tax=Flavihumibacter solisilvae TaxID=1349421 RepID=UPI00068AF7C1|nr:methyltransferase domain-containing protein [Flavihumibacter solisilvae]